MTPTVEDVMREVKNYFHVSSVTGDWRIAGGCLSPATGFADGAWIAITGSTVCDGVYKLNPGQLLENVPDAVFSAEIWLLAPPPAFLTLCERIAAWCKEPCPEKIRRESFGGYSREMAMDAAGCPVTWQRRFAVDLQKYRKLVLGVKL